MITKKGLGFQEERLVPAIITWGGSTRSFKENHEETDGRQGSIKKANLRAVGVGDGRDGQREHHPETRRWKSG